MAETEVILADNFTLHEAMSGFEVRIYTQVLDVRLWNKRSVNLVWIVE